MTQLRGAAVYSGPTSAGISLDSDVREVLGTDAPIAVRVPASRVHKLRSGSATTDIRTIDGALYRQVHGGPHYGPLTQKSDDLSRVMDLNFGVHDTEQEARDAIRNGLARIILIDGFFWRCIAEPVLVLDRHGIAITVERPGHFPAWRVYSLRESAEAVEAARLLRFEHCIPVTPHASALDPGVELIMPEAIAALPHTARMQAVHDTAAAQVTAVIDLLTDFTPHSLGEAARLLVRTADELNAQTRGHRIAVKASTNGGGQ